MSSQTTPKLTACIVCSDQDSKRQKEWRILLEYKFHEVYVISSKTDINVISDKGKTNKMIPDKSDLPKSVSAAFIHSSDADLWTWAGMEALYLFQFTTPGNPSKGKLGRNLIYRQTSPEFKIYPDDIDETIKFITGQGELPRMCRILNPDDPEFDPHRVFGYEELRKAEDRNEARGRILKYLSVIQKKFKSV